jgi:hypothetical protein
MWYDRWDRSGVRYLRSRHVRPETNIPDDMGATLPGLPTLNKGCHSYVCFSSM